MGYAGYEETTDFAELGARTVAVRTYSPIMSTHDKQMSRKQLEQKLYPVFQRNHAQVQRPDLQKDG